MPKKSRWKKMIGILFLIIVLLIGGKIYMDRKKEDDLYRHGFSLLEEQIATYIVEHYAGVSKVEFSPIYVDWSIDTIETVPVIYDQSGNRAILGGNIRSQNINFSGFGVPTGFYALEFNYSGKHIIYLGASKDGGEIDVSNSTVLPEAARLEKSREIDDNIDALIADGQLTAIYKQDGGSPNAEIVYNLNIIRGEVDDEWQ
ncbi:hypothetical protein E4T82_01795 [Streptococcus cuniculi]|uniref:Uncharacterized protein n=2 Tax=Streptococcus cuniculi TaxID=1432788 RepID=A0A4Y9JD00_9STRE|nr:hypothetical protein [Streptococcus cuniculi]TFU98707.1 hypothetical protein E4T82_01795 [Streptococcus cuniculi]